MQRLDYGTGSHGPGHCFHQHITFYLRAAGQGVPPAAAYPGYLLQWSDLWQATVAREQMFDAAAEHFVTYLEASHCFERYGLQIERIPFHGDKLESDVWAAQKAGDVLLVAVDTYHLPSFVEYGRVHGLTMSALLDVGPNGGEIDLWHWENSALTSTEQVVRSIEAQGSKMWKLHLDHARTWQVEELLRTAIASYEVLADEVETAFAEYEAKLTVMEEEDPPLPEDEAERAILFHVPYRRLGPGSFRTVWLVRSAANRLMHARSAFEELLRWGRELSASAVAPEVVQAANESFQKWKTLNVICARYDLSPSKRTFLMILQQLRAGLEADRQLGLACRNLTCWRDSLDAGKLERNF